MNNNFENWLKKARSRSQFDQLIQETKFLHYAVENPVNPEYFPFHLKVTHFGNHKKVELHLYYETLRELKKSAEYISSYDKTLCEVM